MKLIDEAAKEFEKENGERIWFSNEQQGTALCVESFNAGVEFTQRWIPVEEELPKVLPIIKGGMIDNKDLLILKFKPYDSYEFGVLRELKGKKYWEIPDVGIYTLDDVTHWRQIEYK